MSIPDTNYWGYIQKLPAHSIDPNDEDGSLRAKWNAEMQISGEFGLLPTQAAGLEAASLLAKWDGCGAFIQSAVGSGKAMLSQMLPRLYPDVNTVVLLLPPDLEDEMELERWKWQDHFRMGTLGGRAPIILTYSKLSQPESSRYLEYLKPDLIIADEVQNLGNPKSARTKRFLEYFKNNPTTRFVGLTGTISDKSIEEYHHLLRLAVRVCAFIPEDKTQRGRWRAVLDQDGRPSVDDIDAMAPLCDVTGVPWPTFGDSRKEVTFLQRKACRQAYSRRLGSSYGVLLTTKSSTDSKLVIECLEPMFGQDLYETITEVKTSYELPNGEPVADGAEMARHMQTLSVGFFNRWDWDAVDADGEWNKARKQWMREVRRYLNEHSRPGCDSPALVERWVEKEQPKNNLTAALNAWVKVRDKKAPPTVPVWVSNEVVIWAAEWLKNQKGPAILWYMSKAVGERLELMGVPVKRKKPKPCFRSQPRVALPMTVFHKGHNMQEYRANLVLEMWSSGKRTEQLLGRSHRNGQKEETRYQILAHTEAQRKRIGTAVSRADYIQDTTQQAQKLLLATWINEPDEVDMVLKSL